MKLRSVIILLKNQTIPFGTHVIKEMMNMKTRTHENLDLRIREKKRNEYSFFKPLVKDKPQLLTVKTQSS